MPLPSCAGSVAIPTTPCSGIYDAATSEEALASKPAAPDPDEAWATHFAALRLASFFSAGEETQYVSKRS